MKTATFTLPDYPDVTIDIRQSLWTGKAKVLVNGLPAEKAGELSRAFIIPITDGDSKKLEIDRGGFDIIPRVYIDGEKLELARKLEWYEWLLGGIPFILLYGGALGAMCGLVGFAANCKVMRSNMNTLQKVLSVGGITFASYLSYFIMGVALSLIIHR
jgi:hypothetical protein